MSSKKKYTTIGLHEDLLARLKTEAVQEQRSMSGMIEKLLRQYFDLTKDQGSMNHANKA